MGGDQVAGPQRTGADVSRARPRASQQEAATVQETLGGDATGRRWLVGGKRSGLEDIPLQITLSMPWKKARKYIKEDVRYRNFTDSDYVREQYDGVCMV